MHLYFDKLGILKTIIPHGEIPRQGSTLNIYVCFDEDFFETEEEKQKHSVNIDLILPNNEVVTKNMVPVKPAYMSLFMPVSSSEVTYDFVPGVEYLTYHFAFEPEQATPIAGRVIANVSIVEINAEEKSNNNSCSCGCDCNIESGKNSDLITNTIHFGRAEIFVEKTFGNAKIVVNEASLHYKNLIKQINLLNERMVSTNGTQIISGTKTFTAPVNIEWDLQLENISSSDLIDENTACIHIYNKATEDKHKIEFRQSDGVVALLSDLDDFVTKSSTQTISGQKTYTGTQNFYGAVNLNSIVNFKNVKDIDNENGQRGAYFYVRDEENDSEHKLYFQCKDGVIALKSDLLNIESENIKTDYINVETANTDYISSNEIEVAESTFIDGQGVATPKVSTGSLSIDESATFNGETTFKNKPKWNNKEFITLDDVPKIPSDPEFYSVKTDSINIDDKIFIDSEEGFNTGGIRLNSDGLYLEGTTANSGYTNITHTEIEHNGFFYQYPQKSGTLATTGDIETKIAGLVNSAPEALNTLGELATALENHEDAYDALLETVGKKADSTSVYTIKEIDEKIGEIDSILDTFNGEVI